MCNVECDGPGMAYYCQINGKARKDRVYKRHFTEPKREPVPTEFRIPAPLAGWVEVEEECEEGDIRSVSTCRLTQLWGNDSYCFKSTELHSTDIQMVIERLQMASFRRIK